MTTSAGLPIWLKYSYFVVLAAVVPWAKPTLPMNSEVVDYVNVLFFFLLWVPLLVRRNLDVRLFVPLCLIFAGSLIAMLNSPALGTCVTTLLQESYLYLFFLTLCNVLEDERDVRVLVLAWLAAAAVVGFVTLSQFQGDPEFRARGTFDNPNMAASYLGISCFLVLKPISRFPWPARLLFLAFTFGGMFATKSLSAMLACVLGLGGMALVYLTQGWPGTRGRIGILLFILILGLAGFVLSPGGRGVRNFLDRLPRSMAERTAIWRVGVKTFLKNPMAIGLGPAAFREVGFVSGGHYGVGRQISLHNDYLAHLVERGILGFAGLVALFGTLASILYRCVLKASTRREALWVMGLAGMFLYILVDALTHEVMHYRHVWFAFALIVAQERIIRTARDESGATG